LRWGKTPPPNRCHAGTATRCGAGGSRGQTRCARRSGRSGDTRPDSAHAPARDRSPRPLRWGFRSGGSAARYPGTPL
jgi:hypothetical protein